jgi:hypothetical protein
MKQIFKKSLYNLLYKQYTNQGWIFTVDFYILGTKGMWRDDTIMTDFSFVPPDFCEWSDCYDYYMSYYILFFFFFFFRDERDEWQMKRERV